METTQVSVIYADSVGELDTKLDLLSKDGWVKLDPDLPTLKEVDSGKFALHITRTQVKEGNDNEQDS